MKRLAFLTCAITLMGSIPAFGQVNTVRPSSVPNHQLPALENADFEQASLPTNPVSTEVALQFQRAGVRGNVWRNRSLSDAMRAIETQKTGEGLSGGLSGSTSTPGTPPGQSSQPEPVSGTFFDANPPGGRLQRVAVDGRVFHVLIAHPGLERMPHFDPTLTGAHNVFDETVSRFVVVAIEEGRDDTAAAFVTAGEPPTIHENTTPQLVASFDGPADFAAVPWQDSIAVVYRDRGGIYARLLNIQNDTLAFDDQPWKLADAPGAISRYQLLARTSDAGTIHLLWAIRTDSETNLHYCRLNPKTQNRCQQPLELSRSIAVHEDLNPVNLMIQGEHVYASWIDTRFEGGVWTRTNFAKLFVSVSTDGGRSFARPVSLNRPRDKSDNARYAFTIPSNTGGVLTYWTTDPIQARGWQHNAFHAGWLDSELKHLQVGTTPIAGESIDSTLRQELGERKWDKD